MRAKSQAKENQAAQIDARDITELVIAARVIGGKDRHVLSRQQIGQRHRQQEAVNGAQAESGPGFGAVKSGDSLLVTKTQRDPDEDQPDQLDAPCPHTTGATTRWIGSAGNGVHAI